MSLFSNKISIMADKTMTSLTGEIQLCLRGEIVSSKGIVPDVSSGTESGGKAKLKVKQNVCYIVCALVLNENKEFLMIQESKRSCFGKWYLPAGRMEANETIEEALKREVEEEAGYKCQMETLLLVEVDRGCLWFRFTCLAKVTGGNLKGTPDSESLQAKWCSMNELSQLSIRAHDIFPLIEYALSFTSREEKHCRIGPVLVPHTLLLVRALIVKKKSTSESSQNTEVLVCKKGTAHLPIVEISVMDYSLSFAIARILWYALAKQKTSVLTVHGLLAVEHSGKPAHENDGMCFTCLSSLSSDDPKVELKPTSSDYEWVEIKNRILSQEISCRLQPFMTMPTNRIGENEELPLYMS